MRLINDILDLSKIESGIIERRKENFNLAKVCNELFVTIQAKIDKSECRVTFRWSQLGVLGTSG